PTVPYTTLFRSLSPVMRPSPVERPLIIVGKTKACAGVWQLDFAIMRPFDAAVMAQPSKDGLCDLFRASRNNFGRAMSSALRRLQHRACEGRIGLGELVHDPTAQQRQRRGI